jgi:hypothetical protein
MPLLQERDRIEIKKMLAGMDKPVRIINFTYISLGHEQDSTPQGQAR